MSKRQFAYGFFTAILFFFCSSSWCYGKDGKPAVKLNFNCAKMLPQAEDTVPTLKSPGATTAQSATVAIKEVPKAKKQAAPVAIAVQPIKMTKPKIIKPVIKIK